MTNGGLTDSDVDRRWTLDAGGSGLTGI